MPQLCSEHRWWVKWIIKTKRLRKEIKKKKGKEEKEKEKQNPAKAVCYYTTERMRKNRILKVCYILSCVFAINTEKIVTYSDKDCSLKKKGCQHWMIRLSFISFTLQKTQATCLQSKPKGNWGVCWGKNIIFLVFKRHLIICLSMALALNTFIWQYLRKKIFGDLQ